MVGDRGIGSHRGLVSFVLIAPSRLLSVCPNCCLLLLLLITVHCGRLLLSPTAAAYCCCLLLLSSCARYIAPQPDKFMPNEHLCASFRVFVGVCMCVHVRVRACVCVRAWTMAIVQAAISPLRVDTETNPRMRTYRPDTTNSQLSYGTSASNVPTMGSALYGTLPVML